jgi:type II secretory pathway predicted ATPase ExeA
MYLAHFGLRHAPLGKDSTELWDDGVLTHLKERFQWLLTSPGLGLLTGAPGVGKTAAVRSVLHGLNPHRYHVVYVCETDFGRLDVYRSLAVALGLDPPQRRARLWRELKARIEDLVDDKQCTPVWVLDEAQNLPDEFFRDFPSFVNFAFDSRDLMTVWFVGHPHLAQILDRVSHAALASRLQIRVQLMAISERERFGALIQHAFKSAGAQHVLLSDSGVELLRQASQGLPRQAARILRASMQLAASKKLNHLPDDIVQQAITELRS